MRVWSEVRDFFGVAVLAMFCALLGSGCLKHADTDADIAPGSVVVSENVATPSNNVPENVDDAADGANDETGGETNEGEEVAEEEDSTKVYVAIGDCITVGGMHPGPSYVQMLEGMMGIDVINEGRDSEGSKEAAARIPSVLSRHKPDFLLIVLGLMDATGPWPIDAFYTYYHQIADMTLDAGCTPVLATFPPQLTTESELERSIKLNAEIRRVAARFNIPLVDLEDAYDFRESLYQEDLWHPNAAGSRVVAEEFYRVLRNL